MVQSTHGFDVRHFRTLNSVAGLTDLDRRFLAGLRRQDAELHQRLADYRSAPDGLSRLDISHFVIALGGALESFVAELFGIESELAALNDATLRDNRILEFKTAFVQHRARRLRDPVASFPELDRWLCRTCPDASGHAADPERAVAEFGLALLADEEANAEAIRQLAEWCRAALDSGEGRARVSGWVSFRLPQRLDYADLVPTAPVPEDALGRLQRPPDRTRHRDGFTLTDARMSRREVMSEVHYCVYCHAHEGDFCSRGFPERKKQPELGFRVNPLGVTLTGCPLDEKISEMHWLKRAGKSIAALAAAMADNPMVPVTGHRICNDCMKGCIYQKQDPVDIPQIETRLLTDVLSLPWGVEIYHLLACWNPMRARQYRPQPYNGRRVLIAGMGPAGFSMAHHLTMEGCAVVGIDGLKIEPLPDEVLTAPVRDVDTLWEALDERITWGFGGVAEYGITVRWDKNFLKLIYLTLARRAHFQVFGGVRLGGTLTIEDAWRLGFDHLCIATGTGLPRVLSIGDSLARGMRQASDFLMALQLTGAAKRSSLANLQVRLPAVVIGGGLTAVDTATEVQAYYLAQVEKVLARFEALTAAQDEAALLAELTEEDRAILDEFLAHGRAARAERERAAAAGEAPDLAGLVRSWGGVTLVYRRGLNESPAYQRNHEEIDKALEEGPLYLEGAEPVRLCLDRYGHVNGLVCRLKENRQGRWIGTGQEATIPARSAFVAAGAVPNTVYEREYPGTFAMDDNHFVPHILHDEGLQPVAVASHAKAEEAGPFTSYADGQQRVTFLGDTHPVFQGSVVKAVASALRFYPEVMQALACTGERDDVSPAAYVAFRNRVARELTAQVVSVSRCSDSVLEVVVRAPAAARRFRPGQFYKLQNFETRSRVEAGTRLQMEAVALSGAGTQGDCVRLIVLEVGGSSRLAATLQPGEPVVLMGPTGSPAVLPENETVLVVGGRRGAAVMLGLGPALRERGNRVLYFAGFQRADQVVRQSELEDAADVIVWCTETGPAVTPRRPQDRARTGRFADTVRAYAEGALERDDSEPPLPLHRVDRLWAVGSSRLLRLIRHMIEEDLAAHFRPGLQAIGSVNSPMQCMLQGVCAQCLQWQRDPETGLRTRAVFSCAQQDQPLQWIDLDNLEARLAQNRLLEWLTDHWVRNLLEQGPMDRV